ncbi:UNVERIFIED_CONTAM: alpha/beta fold hydrolase [Campylobacter lari]
MEKYLNIYNENIYFTIEDDNENKPIIFFVHGYADSSKTLYSLLKITNRNYKLAALDLPGCGKSTNNNNITIEYYCKIVQKVIEKEFLGKEIYLLSHSMGSIPCLVNLKMNNIKHLIMLCPLNYNLVQFENDFNKNIEK